MYQLTTSVMNDFQAFQSSYTPIENHLDLSPHFNREICRSMRRQNDRFKVNLFEPTVVNLTEDKEWECYQLSSDMNNYGRKDNVMEQFLQLKRERDVECLKIKEASQALALLNSKSKHGLWTERLVLEKILVQSELRIRLIVRNIQDEYVDIVRDKKIGSFCAKDFTYSVRTFPRSSTESEFFILLIANGIEVQASEVQRAHNGKIIFDKKFVFTVTENFHIKARLFSIKLKDTSKMNKISWYLSRRRRKIQEFMDILFKNLNTSTYESAKVFPSSFEIRTDFSILPSNLHRKRHMFDDPKILNCTYASDMEPLNEGLIRKGFLSVCIGNTDLWTRRWCVLNSSLLYIYSEPQDEDFVQPISAINLVCSESWRTDEATKTRPRTFILDIKVDDVVKKHYFMCDSSDDLRNWIDSVNNVLRLLELKETCRP